MHRVARVTESEKIAVLIKGPDRIPRGARARIPHLDRDWPRPAEIASLKSPQRRHKGMHFVQARGLLSDTQVARGPIPYLLPEPMSVTIGTPIHQFERVHRLPHMLVAVMVE